MVFNVDKFHKYVFGRLFTLMTDHKPLLGLFQEGKAISEMASSRVQRWGLKLAAYTYHLQFRAGTQNGNADALSRLPLPVKEPEEEAPDEVVLFMEQLDESPVTAQNIKAQTGKDPCLSVVLSWVMTGWQNRCQIQFMQTGRTSKHTGTDKMNSVHDGCVIWGRRVVIPHKRGQTARHIARGPSRHL